MNKIVKVLICYSCLNSSAFSYGMQGDLCPELFSPETSEAWKKYALPREKVSSEETIVDVGQALSDLQESGKDDKIAKYLIENILLAFDSGERKACWTKCYNTWKRAKDLLAILVTDVDRISCDDERREYQQAASLAVVDRITEIHTAQFYTYDRKPSYSWKSTHSNCHFKESHDNDQSATRRLYDSIDRIIGVRNVSGVANCPEVYYFVMATLDDIKIGETLYWQREAGLLLFDAQVAALMERGLDSINTIKSAVELRRESLLPPKEDEAVFEKVLRDSNNLDRANKLLAESMSPCSLNTGIGIATAIANKYENLMRIDFIKAEQKDAIMQSSVDAFFDMFARKHLGQFLLTTSEPQISSSMIKDLKNDFASLREIMIAYVNFHSANVESISEALTSFEEMINGMRMTAFVKIFKDIQPDTMNLSPEISQQVQEMPAYMRELFMRTPIEFAEMFDREIDCIDYIIRSLRKHAESIFQKDGDIKTYTKGWTQYILEMLKNFKKAEVAYGVQLAFSSASEIVIHNRLSGAFGGSYDPENVLDCFWNFVDITIKSQAMWDILCEALKSPDYLGAEEKVRSKYLGIFKEKLGEVVALELIHHRSVNSQNKKLYNKYVDELNATEKAYLLNNLAKLIEISQRLYGDASYAIQLIRTISKADDLYKALEASDGNIKYWLEESILKDYIGRIRNIPIKDAVIDL